MIETLIAGARLGTTFSYGLSWGDRGRSALSALLAGLVLLVGLGASSSGAMAASTETAGESVRVIVEGLAGSAQAAAHAVDEVGGSIVDELAIIDGFSAVIPTSSLDRLSSSPAVRSVTPDGQVRLQGGHRNGNWKADTDLGSLHTVTKGAGVQAVWEMTDRRRDNLTGLGVGVALIDSGVVPVNGLTTPGRVVNGPDLSFDSQEEGMAHLDTFGHGTHMAGIIVGRDDAVEAGREDNPANFVGVAPDATLLNVKVAASDGAVDVSQVIAAIDWVVQHRDDNGMNVRVINLSFGTDGVQSYLLDPLAHAAEVAWRKGLVVVVAAGNEGATSTSLTNPAMDPFVLAVGAADPNGTVNRRDDRVAEFSSRGSATRAPDLVAPGRSLVSLRDPGSFIDGSNPTAVVAEPGTGTPRFFRGSGTSQSAAFVSGAVALLLQQDPSLSPDQVKKLLTSTADPVDGSDVRLQGAGLIDVEAAARTRAPSDARSAQSFPTSTGLGSLELARGTSHVADPADGTELVGELDIFGQAWDGRSWSEQAWNGRSWSGGEWLGRSWSGDAWNGRSWSGRSWSGRSWSGTNWTGRSWSGRSWSGDAWNGRSWSGRSWSDAGWTGRSWSDAGWTGRSWSGRSWSATAIWQ